MLSPDISAVIPLALASRCSKAGRKAAGLARLLDGGYQVPEGFVVSADCYRAHLWASGVRILAVSATEAEERVQIRNAILGTDIPSDVWQAISDAYDRLSQKGESRVAVRASAIERGRQQIHFPGAYETFLNVSSAEMLQAAIKRVWASVWGGKAAAYRNALLNRPLSSERLNPSDGNASSGQNVSLRLSKRSEPAMAVIVQRMIDADMSGIVATANTITGDPNSISVSIYSAEDPLNPMHCCYDLRTCRVSGDVGLSDIVATVVEKAVLIESLFGGPVEIEWIIKDGQLWLTQAHKLVDLPKFFPSFSSTKKLYFAKWRRVCAQPISHFSRSLFAKHYRTNVLSVHGYVYIPDYNKRNERTSDKEVLLARKLVLNWQKKAAPKLRSRIEALSKNKLSLIDYARLLSSLKQTADVVQSVTSRMVDLHLASSRFQKLLLDILTDNGEQKEAESVYATLVSGILDSSVMQKAQIQDFAIRASVARDTGKMEDDRWRQAFSREIVAFIRTVGYLYRNNEELFDLATWKSWQEDPDQFFQVIYDIVNRKDEQMLITSRVSDQHLAMQVASRIADSLSGRKRKRFQQVLTLARELAKEYKEAESMHAIACTTMRGILAELCYRLVRSGLIREKGDVFYLTLDEILSLPSNKDESSGRNLAAIIAQRKHELWLERRLTPPETLQTSASQ